MLPQVHTHAFSSLACPQTLIHRWPLHLPTRTLVNTVQSSPVSLPPCPEDQALPINTYANVHAHTYTHLYYMHPAHTHIHCKYTSPHKITWYTHPLDTPRFRLCQTLSRHPYKLCVCALFSLGSRQCRICTHMQSTYMHATSFTTCIHTSPLLTQTLHQLDCTEDQTRPCPNSHFEVSQCSKWRTCACEWFGGVWEGKGRFWQRRGTGPPPEEGTQTSTHPAPDLWAPTGCQARERRS